MGNKNKARRKKDRQREKKNDERNNVTDQEKEDGAQSVIESTTDSVGTEVTSTRENTADCEDLKVGIQESREEQIEASHPIHPSGDSGIDNSLAAGSFLTYETPTTPITAPYPILRPMNMSLCLSFRDIGIVVQAIDNNVRGLEIKALAESIYTRPRTVSVIKIIIRDHARKDAQERVSDDLGALTEFSDGIIPLDQTILLDMFKQASDRLFRLTECQGLDLDVLAKLLTDPSNQSQQLHEFSDKDKKEILSFLVHSTDVTGHVIRVWIEEILDKAELTTDQLTYLLRAGRKIHVKHHGGVVNKHWHLKHVVRRMLKIRTSVVHRNFKFINGEEREFLRLYEYFIREMHLPTYFPLKDAKTELDRYLELKVTSKDFVNILKCYDEVVERCRASEDERRKLKKEIGRLRKQVADLAEENTKLKGMLKPVLKGCPHPPSRHSH